MLLGERLGRGHERGLRAVLDGSQHAVKRHNGLSGAHLPHQQPVHRHRLSEVRIDLRDRSGLVTGQLKRQLVLEPAARELVGLVERRGPAPVGRPQLEPVLKQLIYEQLLKGEPSASPFNVSCVNRRDRGRPVCELLGGSQSSRQRLGEVSCGADVFCHEREHLGRADAFGDRILRRRPARRRTDRLAAGVG